MEGIQTRLFRQSKELQDACFVFRLFDSKFIVSGTVHESAPILVGKEVGGKPFQNHQSLIIGKSPNGQLLLCHTHYGEALEKSVSIIFKELPLY